MKRGNKGLGGEQIEGRHAVTELLIAGRRRVNEIWLMPTDSNAEFVEEIRELAGGVRIQTVDKKRLMGRAQSEAPQGVIAFAEPLPEAEFEDLLNPSDGTIPFLLALDGVTDPHNLGALVRTAECAGVTGMVIPQHRSVNVTATAAKASAGAIEHMPIATVSGIPAALQTASRAGVWTVGLDMDGHETVYDLSVADAPLMLVLGAEGPGLSPLTKKRCEALAQIPQYGTVASLNVSNAGAVACFAIAHKRHSS